MWRQDSTQYGLPLAGDGERPVSHARRPEHWAEDSRGLGAKPAGAVEAWRVFARDTSHAGGIAALAAGTMGATRHALRAGLTLAAVSGAPPRLRSDMGSGARPCVV
jgi:hypothetical protein